MGQRRYLAPWRGRSGGATVEEALDGGGPDAGLPRGGAKSALEGKPAIYHCISRVVDRRLVLGDLEKERFVELMRRYADFCQVRVLTFCVMSNHFHVLVEIPERPAEDPNDEELLAHLRTHYPPDQWREIRWRLEHYRNQGNHQGAEEFRQRFLSRMRDLSAFMQSLKQCFSRWYNRAHRRKGHLWEERFKSVLVEDGHAARVIAAYIDLNPVRAGIVATAEEYRWSGWSEALAGKPEAQDGLKWVMLEKRSQTRSTRLAAEEAVSWQRTSGLYRSMLAEDEERRAKRHAAATSPAVHSGPEPRPVARGKDLRSEQDLLRQRVRYFSDGLVLGSKDFVAHSFTLTRQWFSPGRTSGPRRMENVKSDLRAMRALRVDRYGG